MRAAVRPVLVLVALLLGGACARPSEGPLTGAPVPSGAATPAPDAGPGAPAPAPPGSAPQASQRPQPAADGTPAPRPSVTDDGSPGANGPLYLRASVPRLVIEIDAVEGKAPQAETVSLLRTRLSQVAAKPGGIDVRPVGRIPARGGRWTFDALRAAEAKHRDTHSSSDRASIYFLFVDGTPPKPSAIGVTYSASAAAMFVDQIADASTLLVTAAAIERAGTVHELGHLLSLVNFVYTSPRDHEDPEHRGHSSNERSVMYWAVDNVGVVSILGGRTEPPTEFDSDDLADLADIRAGKLP